MYKLLDRVVQIRHNLFTFGGGSKFWLLSNLFAFSLPYIIAGAREGNYTEDYDFRDSFDRSSCDSQLQDSIIKTTLSPSLRSSRSQSPQHTYRLKKQPSKPFLPTTDFVQLTSAPLPGFVQPKASTVEENSDSIGKFNLFQVSGGSLKKPLIYQLSSQKIKEKLSFSGVCSFVSVRRYFTICSHNSYFGIGFRSVEQYSRIARNDHIKKTLL